MKTVFEDLCTSLVDLEDLAQATEVQFPDNRQGDGGIQGNGEGGIGAAVACREQNEWKQFHGSKGRDLKERRD